MNSCARLRLSGAGEAGDPQGLMYLECPNDTFRLYSLYNRTNTLLGYLSQWWNSRKLYWRAKKCFCQECRDWRNK